MKRKKPRLTFSQEGAGLSWSSGPSIRGVAAEVRFRSPGGEQKGVRLFGADVTQAVDGLQATWRWEPDGTGYRVWVELSNQGAEPILLDSIDVLAASVLKMKTPPKEWSFFQNGWHSWSPTFARHLDGTVYTDPGTPIYQAMHQPHLSGEAGQELTSEWVTVVASGSAQLGLGPSLLLGFVTAKDQLTEVRLHPETAEITARCHLDKVRLGPGEPARSEVLTVQAGPDPVALLEEWADALGQEMEARLTGDPPTGWCSWYYYYGENTADDVLDNVGAIARHDLPLEVILLDDGYQAAIGDWLAVDQVKFPQGMEKVSQTIRQAGHRMGIWTAPFGAASDSQLFRDHPDWFLCDESGEPVVGWVHWGVECYALDCTHPQVLDWLRDTFGQMRTEWGVDFFKIDFIFAAAKPGRRYDPTATRAQALRRGVEAIRAAIGDNAFLLGCGAPLGPCVGLVDGMRVGPDVDPNWQPLWRHDLALPASQSALRNSIARAPMHGRLWLNDPDCLLIRQRGTDQDLVLNEMRTLAAVVALLGGVTIDSDQLVEIKPGRLKYLRQTLPPTGMSAKPLDLFQNELPRLLRLPVVRDWGRWWVMGAINWDDSTTETTLRLGDLGLPAGRYHVYHYWRRRYLGVIEDSLTIERHQPHETAVLLFKPVSERPDLLTSTFHVCQGAVEVVELRVAEDTDGIAMFVSLSKSGQQFGELLFTVPDGWSALEAHVDGVKRALTQTPPNLVALGLTLSGQAEVEVRFARK